MTLLERYQDALRNIPPPGCGYHPYLLTVCNYGVICEMSEERIFTDIRHATPQGKRRISDREITDAVNKALSDHYGKTFTSRPRPEPVVKDGAAARQRIISQSKITTEVDLWEASPIRLWEAPNE